MLKQLFRDRQFYSALFRLAVPIILQNIISASMNILDVAMIGQLGETAVAAVGLGNQAFFIMTLLLFGISTGSAIFTAQYWGQKDVRNIRYVLGICLALAAAAGLIFTFIALVIPDRFLAIYTKDALVIEAGTGYLRTVGISYLATAITFSFASVLRSTEEVRLPMAVSIGAIVLKTILSYVLIFGLFGFPKMGIIGAATGTVIGRFLECCVLLILAYKRKTPAAASLKELNGFKTHLVGKYFRTVLPVAFNEFAWSIGISVYNMVYARIGTEAIAAVNIVSSIESLAFVIFLGVSDATGILIGNRIGAGEDRKAFGYARRSLMIGFIGAVSLGLILLAIKNQILQVYNISDISRDYADKVLIASAATMWMRTLNLLIIVGVLRAGGDTRFAMAIDISSVWAVGVPIALVSGMLLHLPVYYVYPLIMIEEFAKLLVGVWRFSTGRWINNLIKPIPATAEV